MVYLGLILLIYGFTRYMMKEKGSLKIPLLIGILGAFLVVDPVHGVAGVATLVLLLLAFSWAGRIVYRDVREDTVVE